jgi:O-antigen/teichoic acid export membrane protein
MLYTAYGRLRVGIRKIDNNDPLDSSLDSTGFRVDRNFLLITFGRVFQLIIGLVAVRVFTTMLSTAEVGNLYLINSIVAFYGLALINPIHMYIYRKIYRWAEEKHLMSCFFVFNGYLLLVSFISLPLTYLLSKGFGMARSVELSHLMFFLVLYIFLLTWNQMVLSIINILNHRKINQLTL